MGLAITSTATHTRFISNFYEFIIADNSMHEPLYFQCIKMKAKIEPWHSFRAIHFISFGLIWFPFNFHSHDFRMELIFLSELLWASSFYRTNLHQVINSEIDSKNTTNINCVIRFHTHYTTAQPLIRIFACEIPSPPFWCDCPDW